MFCVTKFIVLCISISSIVFLLTKTEGEAEIQTSSEDTVVTRRTVRNLNADTVNPFVPAGSVSTAERVEAAGLKPAFMERFFIASY